MVMARGLCPPGWAVSYRLAVVLMLAATASVPAMVRN
jgi:hypothetical protein